jgi:hypothetical protein
MVGNKNPLPAPTRKSSDKYFGPNLTGFQNLSGFYRSIFHSINLIFLAQT